MSTKFYTILIAFTFLALPAISFAVSVPAGVGSRLWFSKDPFDAGETITVYALIYNSSEHRLNGMITLHDSTTTVDKKPFEVDANGGSRIVSFPFFVKEGAHNFFATLAEVTSLNGDGATIVIDPFLSTAKTSSEVRSAHLKKSNALSTKAETTASLGIPAVIDATKQLATTSANVVSQVSERIVESAPVSVASRAIPVLGGIEGYRLGQATLSSKRVQAIEGTLPAQAVKSTASSTERSLSDAKTELSHWSYFSSGLANGTLFNTPFRYVELFFALLWNMLTTHVLVFYFVIIFVLYKIMRIAFGMLF